MSKKARQIALIVVLGVVAAPLLGLEIWNVQRDARFEAENPPPGRVLQTRHTRIHAIERGEGGPPVLLIHGNPGTALDLSGTVMDRIATRRRAVAVDRPGHGWSGRPLPVLTPLQQAALLREAVEQLGLERPVVCGFSYGAPVALAYAVLFPKDVSALVLVAGLADPATPHLHNPVQALLAKSAIGPLLAWTVGPLLAPGQIATGLDKACAPDAVAPACLETALLHWTRPGPMRAAAADWVGLDQGLPALAARYGEIKVPIEVVDSKDDAVVPPAHGDFLAATLEQVHLVRLEGHGHMLPYAAPEAIADAIERAVLRIPAETPEVEGAEATSDDAASGQDAASGADAATEADADGGDSTSDPSEE